ncbi:MAG: hypothetical protein M3282_01005 [Gemmatimonadota bacterium]|nr:hypothetical protein [Gemmatimonadota bacterium]
MGQTSSIAGVEEACLQRVSRGGAEQQFQDDGCVGDDHARSRSRRTARAGGSRTAAGSSAAVHVFHMANVAREAQEQAGALLLV